MVVVAARVSTGVRAAAAVMMMMMTAVVLRFRMMLVVCASFVFVVLHTVRSYFFVDAMRPLNCA